MASLFLDEDELEAVLWAVENTAEERGEWFNEHWPSERGAGWLQWSMGQRMKLQRLAAMLREQTPGDDARAERIARAADQTAADILNALRPRPGGRRGRGCAQGGDRCSLG